jgi:hypothetical protein
MTTPQLMRLLLPKSLASAGWDIVRSRRGVEGILFDDEEPPESLHPALRAWMEWHSGIPILAKTI